MADPRSEPAIVRRHLPRSILFSLAVVASLMPAHGSRAAAADASRVLAGQLELARGLMGIVAAKRPGENVIVSPASAAGMLVAVDLGAGPAMHGDILKVLGIAPGPAGEADLAALREAAAQSAQGDELSTATRHVFDSALHPSAEGLGRLTGAGIEGDVADLHALGAVGDINAWVSRVTRGRIPSIVDDVDPKEGMIALNALAFLERWKDPFETAMTSPADFTAASGRRIRVPFMHGGPHLAEVRQDDRFVAVELPFQGGRFRLVALTTRGAPGEAADFADHLDWLDGRGFVGQPVAVDLPRFEGRAKLSLLPMLSAMGLDLKEPFTGFATDRLILSDMLQTIDLSVDERGAEVAVATESGFGVTAGLEFRDVLYVSFDKPFAFALREARTGLILASGFMGELKGSAVAADAAPVSAHSPFAIDSAEAAALDRAMEDALRLKAEPRPDSDTHERRLRLEPDF